MTAPDDLGLLPDGADLDALNAPEPADEPVSESESPAPEVQAEPAAAPPAPDPWAAINRLAEQQAETLRLQREEIERRNAPPAPAAWVDPYDRPENTQRLDDLEERATYDPQARADLRTFRRQLDNEIRQHERGQLEQSIRAEMQAGQQVETAVSNLRREARAHGDLVTDDALEEVQNEVFAGQPAHVRANALQDPALRALIVQAAAGRRVLSGQVRSPSAPPRPTPPPAVRSDNRATPPAVAKQQEVTMWNDREYLESAASEIFFGKRSKRTTDHEELLS